MVDNLQLETKSLNSYNSLAMNTPTTNFKASNTVYFAATINSTDALILNRTVQSVCFILNPQLGNTACIPYEFTVLPTTVAAHDPVFSVDLSQTRAFTNASDAQNFAVQVTFGILWNTATPLKRDQSEPSSTVVSAVSFIQVSEDTGSPTVAEETDSNGLITEEHWKVALIAAASVLGVILVAGVVLLSVFLRRRQKNRDAERAFNFSQIN